MRLSVAAWRVLQVLYERLPLLAVVILVEGHNLNLWRIRAFFRVISLRAVFGRNVAGRKIVSILAG
jgi:hypothetical protein